MAKMLTTKNKQIKRNRGELKSSASILISKICSILIQFKKETMYIQKCKAKISSTKTITKVKETSTKQQ